MLSMFSNDPLKEEGLRSSPWQVETHARDILIPLEVDNSNFITGFVVLDDQGFPEGGQNTLFEYAGSDFRESHTSLTIIHELDDPTLEDGYTVTLLKLAHSIDQCNEHTRSHASRTSFWARQLSRKLGFTDKDVDRIALASKLHDIGKVVVPKAVLTKPSQLSDQEWLIMRRHPSFGAMIMEPSSRLRSLIPLVKAHHERIDGTGYPLGLMGEEIPIGARIISVADAYTTITEGRVYRLPGTSAEAITELKQCSGKQFDPLVIDAMVSIVPSG